MRKNLFITLDFPPQKGGVATYISHICKHLPKDKIVVLAHRKKEQLYKYDTNQDYKIIRKNFYPKWYNLIFFVFKIIKKYKIEIIHNSHVIPLGYITLITKKIKKIPYIIYLHGLDIKLAKKNKWKNFWLKIILNNAEYIIANSIFTKQEILKINPEYDKKIHIIYPCPHERLFRGKSNIKTAQKYANKIISPRLNPENPVNQGQQILLTISRLVKRKGHSKVLQIMPKLLQKYPNLHYIIIGDGVQKQALQDLAKKLNIESNVDFLGTLATSALPAYFSICDIFIMPNLALGEDVEGFGIVFLEAAVFAKPVIGGNNGGAIESIKNGETGFLVDPNNTTELYDAVDRLLSDPDLCKRLGENGRQRLKEQFNWETQTAKLINLIEK
jgi:phosphatidylinositol alpha-1,6-mannosyltransferase